METSNKYVLGDDEREAERLFSQHRAWRPFVLDGWRRAGFRPGQTLLDMGCGPGAATLDLADLVGDQGRVIAVDASPSFLEILQRRAAEHHASNITTICSDILDWIPQTRLDGVWCRWIFAFVRDPQKLVRLLRDWCTPKGRIVIHEYYDYGAWRMYPDLSELNEFVALVMRSWRMSQGEPDIALALPGMLTNCGFTIVESRPLAHIVTVKDHLWNWLKGFILSSPHRLQKLGYLTANSVQEIETAFLQAEKIPNCAMVAPAVLEIIAENTSSL